MGRLIDADLLMQNYDLKNATKYGNKTAQQQEHSYSSLMMYEIADMIEDEPTAYDVESVVKQIEELKMQYYLTIANTGDEKLDFAYKEVGNAIDKAIAIVKNGGVK